MNDIVCPYCGSYFYKSTFITKQGKLIIQFEQCCGCAEREIKRNIHTLYLKDKQLEQSQPEVVDKLKGKE